MSINVVKNIIVLNAKSTLLRSLPKNRYYSSHVPDTKSLRGIFPQLSTPFKAINDGGICWSNMEKNLICLEESQSFRGYVLNGFFGEGPHLSSAERTYVVKLAKKVVGRNKKLIVNSRCDCKLKKLGAIV